MMLFLMALGKPLACVNVSMDAIFMCMFVCGELGGTSVCLCVSNEGSFNVDE